MNRYPLLVSPGSWAPSLRPNMVRLMRVFRQALQRRDAQLYRIQVQNGERVRELVSSNQAVLITPNHASHADPYTIYHAADEVGSPFYVMAAWHVFKNRGRVIRKALQWHGVFSVDREAADLGAFRHAVNILESKPHPLVVFPEGEIYHCNDRVTPFREGPAAMALAASKKAPRPVQCLPCAIRYRYVDDPMPQILQLMDALEDRILWRPRPDKPLVERIYHFAQALCNLKEAEHLGCTREGPLKERLAFLVDAILTRLELQHGLQPKGDIPPKRVKDLRRKILDKQQAEGLPPEQGLRLQRDLDDVFFVVQCFSYPGDYLIESPTVERIAETLDKFEEDVLKRQTASIKGRREAEIRFGEPIEVVRGKINTEQLTSRLETEVQTLLKACAASMQARPIPQGAAAVTGQPS